MKIEPLEGAQRMEGSAGRLGPVMLQTDRGLVRAEDAPGFMTLLVIKDDGSPAISVLTFMPPVNPSEVGSGMMVQLTPDFARAMGASLLKLANEVGVSPVQ